MTNPPPLSRQLKFRLRYADLDEASMAGEVLWGQWLDRRDHTVLAGNNAFDVPLAVNDVVRVAPDATGRWQAVEVVDVTSSIVTFTSFDHPVTVREARAVYDKWRAAGHALHTDGDGRLQSTAWHPSLRMLDLLTVLTPTMATRGWKMVEAWSRDQRLLELNYRLDLELDRGAPHGR